MIHKLLHTCILIIITQLALAQANTMNAAQVAQKIAKKMKDSLNLTGNQKNSIYDVNMSLHSLKQDARSQILNNSLLLTTRIQAIEKTRDSLYKPLLIIPQYNMYKLKKRNLVSNN